MNWLGYGAAGLVALFVSGAGYALITDYSAMATKIAEMQREANLNEGRLASYKRMIDRRDAAINASQCKAQIEFWVKNPDDVPKPFDPFNTNRGR